MRSPPEELEHLPIEEEGEHQENGVEVEPTLFGARNRFAQTAVGVLVLVAAIYFLLPRALDLDDAFGKLDEGDPVWIAIGFAFTVGMFAAYVALFRGVVGSHVVRLRWRESYEITMAGLAATRLFSAGGAGGLVLTYWALRRAGVARRNAADRMVAFLVLTYAVYLAALVIFGVLLRTGVLPGDNPVGLTIVPAAIAGGIAVAFLLFALIPHDFERRLARHTSDRRWGSVAQRLATVPATLSTGTRIALHFVREPKRGGLAIAGAIGFWAANIGILWASFEAFGVSVPFAVLVQGFFVGMAANLIPGAPGGVGTVDAGMVGAFVLFGLPGTDVFAAVLGYRILAFWLPIPPGIVAFFQLRRRVAGWNAESRPARRAGAAASSHLTVTSESEVT